MRGDLTKALHQINESISTNSKNNRAVALKVGNPEKAGRL